MLTTAMTFLTTTWNKIYTYVIVVGAAFAAVATFYWKARRDERVENERNVLRQDASNRRQADEIRRDVERDDDSTKRLYDEWRRARR